MCARSRVPSLRHAGYLRHGYGDDLELNPALRGVCETALRQRPGQLLDAGVLPELALLESEFAPRDASAPAVAVHLPALTSFGAPLA